MCGARAARGIGEASPVAGEVFEDAQHARRQHVRARAENVGKLGTQEADTLAHRNPAFQHEGTNLIDDARALRDEPLAYSMQSLKVELIGRLGGDELHCRPLHRFRNRLSIVEVVLLPLCVRPHILCRHQSGIVAEHRELAREMMRPDTGLHADQAG